MLKFILLFAFLGAGSLQAAPAYRECAPYGASIMRAVEQHIKKVPHYSTGYQFAGLSVLQDKWPGGYVCGVSFSRGTLACDEYHYRYIYVSMTDGRIVADKYSESGWCEY